MKFNLNLKEFVLEDRANVPENAPAISNITKLMCHGGFYSTLDANATAKRLERVKSLDPSLFKSKDIASLADDFQKISHFFFYRIVDNKKYVINSSLITHLTQPFSGRTYSEETNPNDNIPTFMTFIGQFIDHDLTLNLIQLMGRSGEAGDDMNFASPQIDLDSVYGGRSELFNGGMWDIFNKNDGTFKLRKLDTNAYDLTRNENEQAYIYDARNDENQIILQIHILIMRLHNALAALSPKPDPSNEQNVILFIKEIQIEVIRNWQSFIWHEYLPKLIAAVPLKAAIEKVSKTPKPEPFNKMPHEFSISFRMGHTQLRSKYRLNTVSGNIDLFDNTNPQANDLRGNRFLPFDHVIDWRFFTDGSVSSQQSNLIDGKVTNAVFNLPESAIPDNAKDINNLPQRNLMRSSQVELACAEDIAAAFGIPQNEWLTADEVEANKEQQKLFKLDNTGNYSDSNPFRTPLWYYVIKEAEVQNMGRQLGQLGGRIIGEVLVAGIFHHDESFINDKKWTSKITNTREVGFSDLINFIDDFKK